MVRHQHPAPHRNAGLRAVIFQQVTIEPVVCIGEKSLLATVPALRHMMGNLRNDKSPKARHSPTLTTRKGNVNNVHCHRNSKFSAEEKKVAKAVIESLILKHD